jgi:nucleoredoxin
LGTFLFAQFLLNSVWELNAMFSRDAFNAALGSVFLRGSERVGLEALQGKHLGVLFSASWCPPCRMFKPVLIEAYENARKAGHAFEIVFVSSDSDAASFDEYRSHQPWLAMPYEDRAGKAALSSLFGVQGIPTFIMLDADRNVVNRDARSVVTADVAAARFPWAPPTFEDLLGELDAPDGSLLPASALQGKVVALYFTASWCGPCQRIQPAIVAAYRAVKERHGDAAEFVLVSLDSEADKWAEARAKYPCLAMHNFGRERAGGMAERFEVESIPSIVVVDADADRTVLVAQGLQALLSDPTAADWPWHPKPVNDLRQPVHLGRINEMPTLVLLTEYAKPDVAAAAVRVVSEVAEEMHRDGRGSEVFFVTGTQPSRSGARLRALARLPDPGHPALSKQCLSGHALVAGAAGVRRQCDLCGAVGDGSMYSSCVECDYDACVKCLAHPPKQPVRHVCVGDECRW